jgi:glycosyltransferase involved in cell wall biosynthesis
MTGVEVRRLGPPPEWPRILTRPLWGLQARRYLTRQAGDFDLLHVHGSTADAALVMERAKGLGLKTILKLTLLGSDDPVTLRGTLAGRCFTLADAVVATSTALADTCHGAGLRNSRVEPIPNAVDCQRFRPVENQAAVRQELGLPAEAFIGVTVGSPFEPRKRIELLVQAWAEAWPDEEEAYLLVVGPMDRCTRETRHRADRLTQAIQTTGLDRRVLLTGRVCNPELYLQAADVFVFASVQEGQPNALLEAMGAGLPCVVSRLPGITDDLIVHGRTGLLAEAGDHVGLAKLLRQVRQDGELRATLSQEARAQILRSASLPVVVAAYLRLYRDLLGKEAQA